jgi:hypothetical protein
MRDILNKVCWKIQGYWRFSLLHFVVMSGKARGNNCDKVIKVKTHKKTQHYRVNGTTLALKMETASSPKRWLLSRNRRGYLTQKITIRIATAVKILNLTL